MSMACDLRPTDKEVDIDIGHHFLVHLLCSSIFIRCKLKVNESLDNVKEVTFCSVDYYDQDFETKSSFGSV